MVSRGGRCLCLVLILTGFLLAATNGETTSEAPTTAPVVQTAPIVTTAETTTLDPSTPVQVTTSETFDPTTTDIHDCDPNPCMNGGTCADGINNYTCDCNETGFEGTNCTIDTDECLRTNDDYPCDAVNGNCTNTPGSYMCTCNLGFETNSSDPSACSNIDDCSSDPCQNGGTCNDLVNDYNCTCPDGFNGTHCDFDIRECESTPCKNNGTCFEGENYFNCTCLLGFNGSYCEHICPDGTFGYYCMESCTCVYGANCSNVDGSCTCEPAFEVAVCDRGEVEVTASRASNDTISEGDDFTLACQVNLAGEDLKEVAWYRNGDKLLGTMDEDYSVDSNPAMGMYSITILEADAVDTGAYRCTAVTIGNIFNASSEDISVYVVGG